MKAIKGKKTTARKARGISVARLADMIEEATVDAHDESEQAMGWFTMFEEYLEWPFETEVLGVSVSRHADRSPRRRSTRRDLRAWRRRAGDRARRSAVAHADARRGGVDRSLPAVGRRTMTAPKRAARAGRAMTASASPEIDRGKLRDALRTIGDEYVFYMLDEAIDLLPPDKRG